MEASSDAGICFRRCNSDITPAMSPTAEGALTSFPLPDSGGRLGRAQTLTRTEALTQVRGPGPTAGAWPWSLSASRVPPAPPPPTPRGIISFFCCRSFNIRPKRNPKDELPGTHTPKGFTDVLKRLRFNHKEKQAKTAKVYSVSPKSSRDTI